MKGRAEMTEHTATQTPITDEQAALVGKRWEGRNGAIRYYINDWAALVGLEIDRYKSGNICGASYRGEPLSNGKAGRLLTGKLWIEGGKLYSTIDWDDARIEEPALRALVVAEIARRQGEQA